MKKIFYFLLIIIFATLQTTLGCYIQIFNVRPNFLLCYSICAGLLLDMEYGGVIGFLCGFTADTMSIGRYGFNSIMLMFTGFLCGYIRHNFFRENLASIFIISSIASFVYSFSYYFWVHFIWGRADFINTFILNILPQTIYSTVVTVIMYYILRSFNHNERNGYEI